MMPSAHLTMILWESVPIPAMAQGSSIWEHGGARGGQVPQLLPGAGEEQGAALWMSHEPWAALQAAFLDEGLV